MRKYLNLVAAVFCGLVYFETANAVKNIDPLKFKGVPQALQQIKDFVNHKIPKAQLKKRTELKKYHFQSTSLYKKGPLNHEKISELSKAYAVAVIGSDNKKAERFANLYVIEYYLVYFGYYFKKILNDRILKLNPHNVQMETENKEDLDAQYTMKKEDLLKLVSEE